MNYKLNYEAAVFELLNANPEGGYERHGKKYPSIRSLCSRLEQLTFNDEIDFGAVVNSLPVKDYNTLIKKYSLRCLKDARK